MKWFKLIFPVLLSIISIKFTSAQNNYFTHTLKEGETLSALAKEYNTNVGDIMRLNGMHADSKLVYGSKIKIPAAQVQESAQKSTEQKQPAVTPSNALMHKVAEGETLYSVSKKYNVSVEQLKGWNQLQDDNLKLGSNLIVGNDPGNAYALPSQKETARVEHQDQANIPVSEQTQNNSQSEINETKTGDINTQTNEQAPTAQMSVNMNSSTVLNKEGYFADQFQPVKKKHAHNISGLSKTFKTASGWNDGKYYILANDIDPGTIVKVTTDDGNTVYAKVLWNMGDLKENSGLDFRISNAAAAALQINNSSFNLNVSY